MQSSRATHAGLADLVSAGMQGSLLMSSDLHCFLNFSDKLCRFCLRGLATLSRPRRAAHMVPSLCAAVYQRYPGQVCLTACIICSTEPSPTSSGHCHMTRFDALYAELLARARCCSLSATNARLSAPAIDFTASVSLLVFDVGPPACCTASMLQNSMVSVNDNEPADAQ